VRYPTKTFFCFDGVAPSAYIDTMLNHFIPRHNSGGTVTFMDGHAKWIVVDVARRLYPWPNINNRYTSKVPYRLQLDGSCVPPN